MKKKVVLAFSGGLDTSFCVPYLIHERGLEVHTILVNTGGFDAGELAAIEAKALQLGAASHLNFDATDLYYQKSIKYMLFGNVLKNNTYPLSVSSERAIQAMETVRYARRIGAQCVAHGSTGAGNDQVRFDYFIQVLAPEMEILALVRELRLSRKEEIQYLQDHGFDFSWEKAKYSINQGLWGTSIGGVETLTAQGELPQEAYPHQVTAQGTETLSLTFQHGEAVALDGVEMDPVALIRELTRRAGAYGIGRDIHIGDTIVGIKGRVGFEAPAPLILIKAHHLLEKHVLSKWQLYWKEQLANWYGMLLHEAQYLDPVMRNIEAFLDDSQKTVCGTVTVRLRPYHFTVVGCQSPFDMMNARFGDYGEGTQAFDGRDVEGFTRILSLPVKILNSLQNPQD